MNGYKWLWEYGNRKKNAPIVKIEAGSGIYPLKLEFYVVVGYGKQPCIKAF